MPAAVERHVARAAIERVTVSGRNPDRDELVVEEPLEIRVDGQAVAVTMRTPGEDEELAVGFLLGEGLIRGPDDVTSVGPTGDLAANIVEVRTRDGLTRDPRAERSFHLTSSCGVCGKAALEHVEAALGGERPNARPESVLETSVVRSAPDATRASQDTFERTGGLHATGLFTLAGKLVHVREDIGRHNAMDKAIGARLLDRQWPLTDLFACLSGRVSFELVQKAVLSGLFGIVAVGAPSTLAVDLAGQHGLLLCGFVRDGAFNVYAGGERLTDTGRILD